MPRHMDLSLHDGECNKSAGMVDTASSQLRKAALNAAGSWALMANADREGRGRQCDRCEQQRCGKRKTDVT